MTGGKNDFRTSELNAISPNRNLIPFFLSELSICWNTEHHDFDLGYPATVKVTWHMYINHTFRGDFSFFPSTYWIPTEEKKTVSDIFFFLLSIWSLIKRMIFLFLQNILSKLWYILINLLISAKISVENKLWLPARFLGFL